MVTFLVTCQYGHCRIHDIQERRDDHTCVFFFPCAGQSIGIAEIVEIVPGLEGVNSETSCREDCLQHLQQDFYIPIKLHCAIPPFPPITHYTNMSLLQDIVSLGH
jgi:hypothetical protein